MEFNDFKRELRRMIIEHCPEYQIREYSNKFFRDFYGESMIHGIGYRNNLRVQLEEMDLSDFPEALQYSRSIKDKLFSEVQKARMTFGPLASKMDF